MTPTIIILINNTRTHNCASSSYIFKKKKKRKVPKVIEYCKKHIEAPKPDDRASSAGDELKAWDSDFVKVDQATLFDFILKRPFLLFLWFFFFFFFGLLIFILGLLVIIFKNGLLLLPPKASSHFHKSPKILLSLSVSNSLRFSSL